MRPVYNQPSRRLRKHRKDYNNGKRGWVGGNPRYCRGTYNPTRLHKHRTMKGLGRN